jgi:pimeloyl-ACP methyl ester carboxylesterase
MQERTSVVEVGRQPVFVREWGEASAPVTLFVHGSGDDSTQAARLGTVLADAWRVVAPDIPGHGRTPEVQPEAYVPSRMVALLVRLLDELAIDAASLVGFSWGASICCHLAAGHLERALSVVLLEGGHIDFQDLRDFDAAAVPAADDVAAAMGRGLVREPVAPTYRALRESAVPLLLVTAFRDEALGELRIDPLARLAREVPQATIARLSVRGHDLLRDDDGTVAGIVREWLRSSGLRPGR